MDQLTATRTHLIVEGQRQVILVHHSVLLCKVLAGCRCVRVVHAKAFDCFRERSAHKLFCVLEFVLHMQMMFFGDPLDSCRLTLSELESRNLQSESLTVGAKPAEQSTSLASWAALLVYILHFAVCSFDTGGCTSAGSVGAVLLLSSSQEQTVLAPARRSAIPTQVDSCCGV